MGWIVEDLLSAHLLVTLLARKHGPYAASVGLVGFLVFVNLQNFLKLQNVVNDVIFFVIVLEKN